MALQKQGTDHLRNPGQPGGRLPRETSTHFGSLKDLCTPSGMPGSLPKVFHSFGTPGTVIRRVRAVLNPSRTTTSKLSRPVPSLPSWSARGTRVWKARLCPQGTPPFQLYNSILLRKRFLGLMKDKVNSVTPLLQAHGQCPAWPMPILGKTCWIGLATG